MKTFLVLSAVLVAGFASSPDDSNWQNARQAAFTPKGLESVPPIQGRIFGGNLAQPHQFPYQVGLYMIGYLNNGDVVMTFCGGSLISKEFILTAAHCLLGQSSANVALGAQNIKKEEKNVYINLVSSKNFVIHPEYKQGFPNNDVALIKLPAPVELNEFIQTIQLPRPTMLQPQLEGRMVVMTGWGRNGNSGDILTELHYANLRVLPERVCTAAFGNAFQDSQVCVSGTVQSVCHGDSGGPLVAQEEDGTKVVIGIASFIRREGCEKGFPTVFTRVTSYLDWISKSTGIPIRN